MSARKQRRRKRKHHAPPSEKPQGIVTNIPSDIYYGLRDWTEQERWEQEAGLRALGRKMAEEIEREVLESMK